MANSTVSITNLDFDSIKASLIAAMKSDPVFKDYNFQASGLNSIIDVLVYNTYYNNYYLNMVGNEMFIDTALLRSSVISHAKMLNYTPRSAIAPTATINLKFNGVTDLSVTLPKFTKFMSQAIDGQNYTFVTTNAVTQVSDIANSQVTFSNVVIKQGFPVNYQYTVDTTVNPKLIFKLPDSNIDTTTLSITVQQSGGNTSFDTYTLATNVLNLNGTSKVYFLQESLDGFYEIYFGDGIIGKTLINGNIVKISYLSTYATTSHGANSFVLLDVVQGYSNYVITPLTPSNMGQEKETIQSIKFNAPKTYMARGAITPKDYIPIIQNNSINFPIDAVNVWGGEDNIPPIYGKVFIAIKPKGGYILTNAQKTRLIQDVIKPASIATVSPEIVDVDYTYLNLGISILYNQSKTTLNIPSMNLLLTQYIQNFVNSKLNTFNSSFVMSDLITQIQSADASIVSVDVRLSIQKRFVPTLNKSGSYTLNFGVPLRRDVFGKSIYNTPSFKYIDTNNNSTIRNDVYIEEVPNQSSGISNITVLNPGYSYSTSPTVTISGDGTGANAYAVIVNQQISQIVIDNQGTGYTQALVTITGGSGYSGSAYATLNGNSGTLRLFYYINGVKTILNPNIGTVDYDAGKIVLNNFSPLDINSSLGVLSVNATPKTRILNSSRDKIITLDTLDPMAIQINITAQ